MRSSTPMVSHVFSSSPPSPPALSHRLVVTLFVECLFWQHTHAVYTLSTIITGRRPRGPGES